MHILCTGVLRGAGKQNLGAKANLVGYWLVCIPTALVLAIAFDWQVRGLITGLLCGVTTTLLIYSIAIWKLNWYHEAELSQIRLSQERMEQSHINVHDIEIDNYDTQVNGSNDIAIELSKIDDTSSIAFRSPSGGIALDRRHSDVNDTHHINKQFNI